MNEDNTILEAYEELLSYHGQVHGKIGSAALDRFGTSFDETFKTACKKAKGFFVEFATHPDTPMLRVHNCLEYLEELKAPDVEILFALTQENRYDTTDIGYKIVLSGIEV